MSDENPYADFSSDACWHLATALQGNRASAIAVFQKHQGIIHAWIREQLKQPLRRLIDSVDVMQDTQKELLRIEKAVFASERACVGFILGIAENILLRDYRYYLAARRDL